jgi:hypothetical protein
MPVLEIVMIWWTNEYGGMKFMVATSMQTSDRMNLL